LPFSLSTHNRPPYRLIISKANAGIVVLDFIRTRRPCFLQRSHRILTQGVKFRGSEGIALHGSYKQFFSRVAQGDLKVPQSGVFRGSQPLNGGLGVSPRFLFSLAAGGEHKEARSKNR